MPEDNQSNQGIAAIGESENQSGSGRMVNSLSFTIPQLNKLL